MGLFRLKKTAHCALISANLCVVSCGQDFPDFSGKKRNNPAAGRAVKDPNAKNSSQYDSLDEASLSKKIDALNSEATGLAREMDLLNKRLEQVFQVKKDLCERQTDLFSGCLAHTPLSSSQWKAATACRNDRKTWDNKSFSVYTSGLQGRFKLVLDNSIESNSFESDRETKLSWHALGSRSLRNLKLSDISSYKLRAVEGNLRNAEIATFSLKLGNVELLSQKDFILGSQTETAMMLTQVPISDRLASNECRVEENEIEEISRNALAKAAVQAKVTTPQFEATVSKQNIAVTIEEWIEQKRREYMNKGDIYLASAQDIARLRRDLRGNLQLGCWGRQIIKTIDISIQGNHLPLADWDRSQSNQTLPTVGEPTGTTIDLGGDLKFTNPDESVFSLFRDQGRWMIHVDSDLTIGDISSLQVKKNGYSYQSLKNCWNTWGGLGRACEWQNREMNRYLMRELHIKINGQSIYINEELNHAFERKSLNWIEKNLTSNQAYIDLMRRRDCPVSELID